MAKALQKNLSTKVLSARVPPDVYDAWQNLASSKNISVSECLRDAVTMVDKKAIKKSVLKAEDGIKVPDELKNVIASIGGGSVAGILLYKGIRITLEQNSNNMNKDEIEAVSVLLALSGALIIGTGIYNVLKP
jgi:hypothetical protein